MSLLLFSILLLALSQTNVYGQDDYCFSKDKERVQTRHFSSLTTYEIAKGTNMDKQYLVPNCTPKKIWILHRHGTRLPRKRVIESAPRLEQLRNNIVKNYENRHSTSVTSDLCDVDYINLKMWRWNTSITVDEAEYLTSQGYADLHGTAKLYQKYYSNILTRDYNPNQFLFRHTNTQRTIESFKAFAEGLFGPNSNARAEPVPENDNLLRPYDMCNSWKEHDFTGPQSEVYKFRNSKLWNDTIEEVSKRLGYEYTLESSDVELMFDICRYEQAWKVDRTSCWCAVFLPEHINVLEYEQDLHYYYKCGYGYDENLRLNCRLVKDMLTQLNSSSTPNSITYFAHSTAIQTLITALGIAKDDSSLLASNYNSLSDRHWKSSQLDPFAANFVAVKYQCDAYTADKDSVIFFLNQNAVELSWCKVGLCRWSDVIKRYENFYNADCDSYYCRSGSTILRTSFSALLLATIAYLIY